MFEALFFILLLVIVFAGFIAMIKFIIVNALEICMISVCLLWFMFYYSVLT